MAAMLTSTNKVLARAILWKLDSGKLYMDRVYANNVKNKDLMYKWGKENKAYLFIDDVDEKKLVVTLPKNDWKGLQYPF